ncbi:MAG: hypothetical protein KBD00_04875 [Candidatus Peribacteraceae bacterium]|nr:hypothetical protein [Candidatus Peribacteraceae bacterium]
MLFSERKKGEIKKGSFYILRKLCSKPFTDLLFEGGEFKQYKYDIETLEHFFLLKTKDLDLTPRNIEIVSNENDLFDMLECAYQFLEEYKDSRDEKLIRSMLLQFLLEDALKEWGYRMRNGLIEFIPEIELIDLADAKIPKSDVLSAKEKIAHAKDLFFKRNSTVEEKKSSIQALGQVLESIRKDLKTDNSLKTDERTIFDILNNYGIRHHNDQQKDIDEPYLTWTYYLLLNTILTFMKLNNK